MNDAVALELPDEDVSSVVPDPQPTLPPSPPPERERVEPPSLAPSLRNIAVQTRFVLGQAKMNVGDLLDLAQDRIIPIDRGLSEPLDMEVNGTLIARAELIEGTDGGLSVRIVELIAPIGEAVGLGAGPDHAR